VAILLRNLLQGCFLVVSIVAPDDAIFLLSNLALELLALLPGSKDCPDEGLLLVQHSLLVEYAHIGHAHVHDFAWTVATGDGRAFLALLTDHCLIKTGYCLGGLFARILTLLIHSGS